MFGKRELLTHNSKISGQISVYSIFGHPRMEIGGLLQSGGVIRQIWKKAAAEVAKISGNKSIENILLLGLGAGTAVEELQKVYPRAKITGIEIDPEIVKIGREYFKLKEFEKNKSLLIVIDDALDFVQKSKNSYKLIIIDIYHGRDFVNAIWQKPFLNQLKKLLKKDGIVVFNHLFWGANKKRAKNFVKDLESVFPNITLSRVLANLLIFARINS